MNIYRCRYKGIPGYAGKTVKESWFFVPDLGAADRRTHHRLGLADLVFQNRHEYEYELGCIESDRFCPLSLITSLFFSIEQRCTTAGMLLLPQVK